MDFIFKELPMIVCKIVPVIIIIDYLTLQNRTHHKKYIRNDISHEEFVKMKLFGFRVNPNDLFGFWLIQVF